MKKIILSITVSMLISLCAVQAQQQKTDTTGTAKSKTQQNRQQNEQSRQQGDQSQQQRGQSWQQQSDRYQNHDAYGNEGMVVIEKDKIPSSLKQTLQDRKYAGWENATIYHNSNTGEYVIVQKPYMFDKQGKEIEMKNSAAYGNREGRRGRYSSDQSQYPSRADQSQNDQSQKDETGEIPTSASKDQPGSTNQSDNQSSQTPQPSSDQNDQAQQNNGQQQPSTSYRTEKDTQDKSNSQSQPGQSSQDQYRTEGMVEVQAEQIPASLRRTLGESQYRGWEDSGKLYQDPATEEYVLVIEQTSNTSQPRSYRFDKNGQMKEDQSGTSKNKQ